MYVVIANFSDDSVALIQWAYEQKLEPLHILYVDTGFASFCWNKRLDQITNWLNTYKLSFHILKPNANFNTLITERHEFPSIRFQWCPGLLKGIPILNWLETYDKKEEAMILLPHRQSMSKAQADLEEYIEESEYYDDRTIWHPLYQHSEQERNTLLERSTIRPLHHRSLECEPCIFSTKADLARLNIKDIEKVRQLEKIINKPMFNPNDYQGTQGIDGVVEIAKNIKTSKENYYDHFAMGCAWPYGCGL